jgi:lipopolysaccharide assembly protein A
MQIFLFIALFIAALAILFAAQNNDTTTVSFFFWQFKSPLALVLLIALAMGAAISFFFSLPSNIKARWTIRQQRKKMNDMESSLETLNNQAADLKTKLEESQKKPEEILAADDAASEPAELAAPAEAPGAVKKPFG